MRARAKDVYVSLVARIGTSMDERGMTFRQAMASSHESSHWWYHPSAFRDCEADPAFEWFIAVLAIQDVASRSGASRLVLYGACKEIVQALKSRYAVEERAMSPQSYKALTWIRSLASRVKYLLRGLLYVVALRKAKSKCLHPFEVAFTGFWDWSVKWDTATRSLSDRYFVGLPEALHRLGITSLGWLVWLDPASEPRKRSRSLSDVLAPIQARPDVAILQSFLRPWDFIQAVLDFHPLVVFLRVRRGAVFREACLEDGIDYYSLLSHRLLLGFLNASIPHCVLVAIATERACRQLRPRITCTFFEHFPYARAHYDGVRRAGTSTTNYAVQHACGSHETTFVLLHPEMEFHGKPDGVSVPQPHYVCAIGALARDLLLESGYPPERVLLTGSPRYDYLSRLAEPALHEGPAGIAKAGKEVRLLIVSTLALDLELDMVEAVACATSGLEGVTMYLRNHPFGRIERHPRFTPYRDRMTLTRGSLSEDLNNADLLLFTYSTVAAEALLQGIPVWQWQPLSFNGSALAEVASVPRFRSVEELRQAIAAFREHPVKWMPNADMQRVVEERLFYRKDGLAAQRIAELIAKEVTVHPKLQPASRIS